MRRVHVSLIRVLSPIIVTLVAGIAVAQQSTMTEIKDFEVVSINGNQVVVKGAQGAQEVTVPDDFRFNVEGRQISVRELRPGMKGSATITTTTTVKPVTVTEVRNGEVMRVAGNAIIVRGEDGIRMFSEADADRRNANIVRNGQPARFTDFRRGDRLTATIVTEKPPEIMTERQVEATLLEMPVPPSAEPPARTRKTVVLVKPRPGQPEATATSGTETAPTSEGSSTRRRRLPRTATVLPLMGFLGAAVMGVGIFLSRRRKRSR